MSKEKTMCLNMIVKNESHIIEKTLENLCAYINFTCWVICDTGSVDNTVEIILNFFNKKNIPGEVLFNEWRDFGHNRTLALNAAFNKTDYLLIFDADDCIIGDFKIPELSQDRYNLFFGSKDFKYVRPLIINNRKRWKFKGILHEFLVPLENSNSMETIEGDYFILSGKEGARSKTSNKYLKDAILLKSRIDLFESSNEEFEDRELLARYTFYCANSFKDCNDIHNAILYYKKVFHLDTWVQEKYLSALNIGDLYEKLNNVEDALPYWYKAISYDKERREAVIKIMTYYYKTGNWFAIHCLHESIKNFEIKDISSKLFLNVSNMYDNHYFNSIACANVSEWMSGYYSCKYLLLNDLHVEITLFNFKCYAYNLHLDPDHKLFLEKLLKLFKQYYNSDKETILNLWNSTSNSIKTCFNLDNIDQLMSLNETCVIKKHNKISLEEASCKILFYTGYMESLWNSSTLKTKSLGGSEKAVIYLSRCFPKNYKIYVAGDVLEEGLDNITYVNHEHLQSLLNTEQFHTIIISRYISFFENYKNFKCFQLVLYAHDTMFLSYPLKSDEVILKDIIDITDYIMCLTEWHKNILIYHHKSIKDANFEIINNGINLSEFDTDELNNITKIKNKFMWSSCSNRGLHILLELWPKILEKLPDATLDICSYHFFPADDRDINMKKIIDKFDSIVHHGKLNTNQLYKLMKTSEYWLYTNTFPETSCITALEMLNNEVICMYYPNAGLVETIGDYGVQVTTGNEIDVILKLTEEDKAVFRKKGKEYALECSWEKRAQKWSKLLRFNEKIDWIFICADDMNKKMVRQYIYNLNNLYTDYSICLFSETEVENKTQIILERMPSKLTFTTPYFKDRILKHFPKVEIGFLNFEPLNISIRLDAVLNVLRKYSFIQYYDYSKSNITIITNSINFTIKNPIYLPYKCSDNEIKLLIRHKNKYKNNYMFDFGIIHDWKNSISKTKTITPPRRNKVVQFLINNGFKINIISGWGEDRDTQLGTCKIILNIHGQISENENPQSEEISNIFEHIRCDRLLESGYNILSETSYNLDIEFANKYSNLRIITYKDFFNLDILNFALNEAD
jgi:hypothetical protein